MKKESRNVSRVLFSKHLLRGRLSVWDVCYQTPQAVTNTGRAKDQPFSHLPCSQPGFTEPAPLDTAGALLPHLCTLTLLLNNKAVFFCGTILTVTCTGRYPASLVFRESGLSSDSFKNEICNHLAYSLSYPSLTK